VDNGGDAVIENAGEGTDTVRSTIHLVLPANVENLILEVGSGDLQGYGNALPNMITGNEGSNLLDGRAGPDVMLGQGGNDFYFVDDAGDIVIESSPSGGNDLVFATAHFVLSANVENLILQGTANLQGHGNGLFNTLWCCKASPTCRATVTGWSTRSTATPATTCSMAGAAPTPCGAGSATTTMS
jgi:Ca2+-binding RTX toxin-like protein